MSGLELQEHLSAERTWVRIGVVVATAVVVLQAAAGLTRTAVSDAPSRLELVQTCLVERDMPFSAVSDDLIALSAARGSLRMIVDGTAVTIALAASDSEADRLVAAYTSVSSGDAVSTLLDRRRKVVFLWEAQPTTSQREFAYLCTLDAQS